MRSLQYAVPPNMWFPLYAVPSGMHSQICDPLQYAVPSNIRPQYVTLQYAVPPVRGPL